MASVARFLSAKTPYKVTTVAAKCPLHLLATTRDFLQQPTCGAVHDFTGFSALDRGVVTHAHFYIASPLRCASYELKEAMIQLTSCMPLSCHTLSQIQSVRFMSNRVVKVDVRNGIARFDVGEAEIKNKYKQHNKEISEKTIRKQKKKEKKSKKAKKSELRFYRLKARKKLKSSNPEVRIKYKLEKALEKFMFEQSLSSVKQFIAVLERELEDYQRHVAFYGKPGDPSSKTKSITNCETDRPSLVKDYRGEDIVSHGRVNDCTSDRLTGSRHGCSLDINISCLVSTAESEEGNSELGDLDMESLKEDDLDSLTGSDTEGGDDPT